MLIHTLNTFSTVALKPNFPKLKLHNPTSEKEYYQVQNNILKKYFSNGRWNCSILNVCV